MRNLTFQVLCALALILACRHAARASPSSSFPAGRPTAPSTSTCSTCSVGATTSTCSTRATRAFLSGSFSARVSPYIDLFGTKAIRKAVFVDEPISIYSHANWSEQERLEAGGMTTSPERMIAAFTAGASTHSLIVDMNVMERFLVRDSPYFWNSQNFAHQFIKNNPKDLPLLR